MRHKYCQHAVLGSAVIIQHGDPCYPKHNAFLLLLHNTNQNTYDKYLIDEARFFCQLGDDPFPPGKT